MSGVFEMYSELGLATGRLTSTDRSAALSFSAPWVYTAMDQSTQRAKPSFNSNSVMFPFCNDHTHTQRHKNIMLAKNFIRTGKEDRGTYRLTVRSFAGIINRKRPLRLLCILLFMSKTSSHIVWHGLCLTLWLTRTMTWEGFIPAVSKWMN